MSRAYHFIEAMLFGGPMHTKQYRNEWKYICTDEDLTVLDARLNGILDRDSYSGSDGSYEVHSLYFDDIRNICVMENNAGDSKRYKYRIRYYGTNKSELKLERKEKLDNRCYKESCRISTEQYSKIVSGNAAEVFWEADEPLVKRFCTHCMMKEFRPKAIIDYCRVAYVEPVTNIRITLDKNITVSDAISGFTEGDYLKLPVQERHMHVLEVKFDSILPGYIRALMLKRNFVQTTFSKYYFGRKKLQEMGRR